jgi:parallel beta-helix repeat protein
LLDEILLGNPCEKTISESFTSYEPISINGNDDFSIKASNFGWKGNGSETSPYIISNVNITLQETEPSLFTVIDTDVHFIVSESLFVGGLNSLRFQNISNANICNNTMYYATSASIYLYRCSNCSINLNEINDNEGRGILLDYSEDCSICENEVGGNRKIGVNLRDSKETVIANNTIRKNRESGLVLGNTPNCDVIGNVIKNNWARGVSIEVSTPIEIANNSIYDNAEEGITFYGLQPMSNITGNTFYRNGLDGLHITGNETRILRNNFIYNQILFDGIGHVTDHSLTNIYSDNYWSGLIYPDEDHDGVVDVPYYIPAPIEKKDEHPRVYAYPDYKIHILTKPIPIFPNASLDTDYYFGMMNVSWAPASDTFLHSICYSLFYSTNETSEWVPVALNISGTEYELNTTEFPHNLTCYLNITARCSQRIQVSSQYEQNFTVREHTLSPPTIVYPNGAEVVGEYVEIHWIESADSWGQDITYDIYYSNDSGDTWLIIMKRLNATTLGWNLKNVRDGSYLVRVVAKSEGGLTSEDISDSVFFVNRFVVYLPTGIAVISLVIIGAIAVTIFLRRRRQITT